MEADTAGTIVTAVGWTSVVVLNIIIFVTSRKDKLRERLDKLRDQLDELSERVGAVELRVSRIEGQLSPSPAKGPCPMTVPTGRLVVGAAGWCWRRRGPTGPYRLPVSYVHNSYPDGL